MPAAVIPASPYDGQHLEEFPLRLAPLVRVLAQVRHPALRVLSGEQAEATALAVATNLGDDYPIFETAREPGLIITPNGIKQSSDSATSVWRLKDASEEWQISFTSDFISIETRKYNGRTDFCNRLAAALAAYETVVHPPAVGRVGIRYTNRLTSEDHLARISMLLRPELLGPVGAEVPDGVGLTHSFGQAQYVVPEGGSLLNWGLLPPNSTFDPSVAAVAGPSWLLDIDSFSTKRMAFEPAAVTELATELATRAYAHFRWSVTDEFLRVFKGE